MSTTEDSSTAPDSSEPPVTDVKPVEKKKIRVELPKNVWIWTVKYLSSAQDVLRYVADPLFNPSTREAKENLISIDYPKQCPDALTTATFVVDMANLDWDILHADLHHPWSDINGTECDEFEFEECKRLAYNPETDSFMSVPTEIPENVTIWLLKTAFHERESDSKLMLRHIFMLHEQTEPNRCYAIISYKVVVHEGRERSPISDKAHLDYKNRGKKQRPASRKRAREDHLKESVAPAKRQPVVMYDPSGDLDEDLETDTVGDSKRIRLDLDRFRANPMFNLGASDGASSSRRSIGSRASGSGILDGLLYNDFPNFDERFVKSTVKAIQKQRIPLKAGIKKMGIAPAIVEKWVNNGMNYDDLKFDSPHGVILWSTWLPSDVTVAKIAIFGIEDHMDRICTAPPDHCMPQFMQSTFLVDMRGDICDDDIRLDEYCPYDERSVNHVSGFKLDDSRTGLISCRNARDKYMADYQVIKYFTIKQTEMYGLIKRSIAYVYPVNEPKPIMAMVNYLRERIPQEELEDCALKPVKSVDKTDNKDEMDSFVDEAAILAEVTKDKQLSAGQAFERMKRLVREYEDKKRAAQARRDAEADLVSQRKRRDVKEFVDAVEKNYDEDIPEEEAQTPFAEYIGERNKDGAYVGLLVHSKRPGFTYKFMTEGSRDRATSHWVCVQCRVQNKPSQARKRAAEAMAAGGDPLDFEDEMSTPGRGKGRGKGQRRSVSIPYKRFTIPTNALPPMSVLSNIDKGHMCAGPLPLVKTLVQLACKEIRARHIQDVNVYDAYKKVMRDLYVDLLQRGYSREEALDSIPYSCLVHTKGSTKSAVQKKRYEAPAEVPVPDVAKVAPGRWHKLREYMQRAADEPFTLDDRELDDQLLADRELRAEVESATRFTNAHTVNLLPGRFGQKMWTDMKNEARNLGGIHVDADDPNVFHVDENDGSDLQYTVEHVAVGDFKCNCPQYVETYGYVCKHTRHVMKNKFWDESQDFGKLVCVRMRSDENLLNSVMEMAENKYEPERAATAKPRKRSAHGAALRRTLETGRIDISVPRRMRSLDPSTAAFHKALAQIPPDLAISTLEWNIIMDKSDEFINGGVVQRFPRDPDLFLVIVDRQPFTVQRHGPMMYECNCDQFAALYAVCMHCMAVSRLLEEDEQYVSLCSRFVVNEDVEEEEAGDGTADSSLLHHDTEEITAEFESTNDEVYGGVDELNASEANDADISALSSVASTSAADPPARRSARASAGKSGRYQAHEEW